MQSNYFDKYINNKILGSFILCNQDLIAVGNIHDIRVFENFGSDILLNSLQFVLDYIKQNDTSLNINNKKLLFKGSHYGWNKICNYNKKNILIIIESDNDYIFGVYAQRGFGFYGSTKKDDKTFLFSANLSKIYPAIKDINDIGYYIYFIKNTELCVTGSLYLHYYRGYIKSKIKQYFYGFDNIYEMNGGKKKFEIKKIEIYEFL